MKAEEGVGGQAHDNVRLCKNQLGCHHSNTLARHINKPGENTMEKQTASHLYDRGSYRRVGVGL